MGNFASSFYQSPTECCADGYRTAQSHSSIVALEKFNEELAGVYVVSSLYRMMWGVKIQRTMTILENNNELVLVNPVRLTTKGEEELLKLGTISKVVLLSAGHISDVCYYTKKFPKCTIYAPPFVKIKEDDEIKMEDLLRTKDLKEYQIIQFDSVDELGPECALYSPRNKLLVTCDVIQNNGAEYPKEFEITNGEDISYLARLMNTAIFNGNLITPSMYLSANKGKEEELKQSVILKLNTLDFNHCSCGHGFPQIGDAKSIRAKFTSLQKW